MKCFCPTGAAESHPVKFHPTGAARFFSLFFISGWLEGRACDHRARCSNPPPHPYFSWKSTDTVLIIFLCFFCFMFPLIGSVSLEFSPWLRSADFQNDLWILGLFYLIRSNLVAASTALWFFW